MRCIGLARVSSSLLVAAVLGWPSSPAAAQAAAPRGATPLAARAQAPAALPQAATDVNFPPTSPGFTSTIDCGSECFTLSSGAPNNCDGAGTISVDKALAAPFQVMNYRVINGTTGCGGTPVTLPVNLMSGQRLVFDFSFSPTQNGAFTDTLDLGGVIWTLNGSTPSSSTCTANSSTLCLQNARFRVTADWQIPNGTSGTASAVQLTANTGYLWFFTADNVEVVIKVLDGCAINSRFWVFAGGLTNVAVTIHVTDTQTGATNNYINAQKTAFPPLQDTSAFPCP